MIRQRIGMVYARRQEYKKAIAQYRIALALQPADVETHQKLIEAYDAIRDQEGAIQQTLALDRFGPAQFEALQKAGRAIEDRRCPLGAGDDDHRRSRPQ